jgi:hypothetical protein
MIRLYRNSKDEEKSMPGISTTTMYITILHISSISQGEVIIGSNVNKQ